MSITGIVEDYQLVPLTGSQIIDYWDALKSGIMEALPVFQGSDQRADSILRGLLEGFGKVWVYLAKGNIAAMVVTSIYVDTLSGVRSLLIYAFKGFEVLDVKDYKKGMNLLKDYARGAKCSRIIAYTDNKRVKQMINWLGGKTDYTLVSLEV